NLNLFSGESTICKNQTDISSDPVRNVFKNQHNQLRSAVARGMVKMKDGIKCRNATQMWKLEYNCGLEASAHEAAKGCRKVDSTSKQFDEVWHVFDKAIPDMKDAAQRAIKLWYKEIETGYMNQTTGLMNMFLPELNIPHFARMIWDSHREIGCAVVKCTSATKVVCHYSPAVVRFGNTIYAMGGRTCNLCERMSAECSKVGLCLKRK
ncbi:SCP-like protein, partial [Ancylostoma caninum]